MDDLLQDLSKELSESEVKNYISQISFDKENSSEHTLIFTAPNEILAKFIQTLYANKISYQNEIKTGIKANVKIFGPNKISKNKIKNVDVKQIKIQSSLLDPTMTFENFIVGNSNNFAYSLAKMAASDPGKKYNPLFIYGPTGLGKTHLLQSIGNYCLEHGKTVIFVTSEQFMTDFIRNVDAHTMPKFKEKYRNCDILLIDDIQFLSRSESIQDEFFNTFNELDRKKSQIVLTSDKHPKQLKSFTDRLKSRFEAGAIADITPPELDTKIRIIKAKCQFDEIYMDDEVIKYIAINLGDNIREIEGAITNINAYSSIIRQPINLEIAQLVLKDQIKDQKENISVKEIIEIVAKNLNVLPSDIQSNKRAKPIAKARRICIYLSKSLVQNTMPQIAEYFGLKDHSAVSKNIKKTKEMMDNDNYFKAEINELKNKITSKE